MCNPGLMSCRVRSRLLFVSRDAKTTQKTVGFTNVWILNISRLLFQTNTSSDVSFEEFPLNVMFCAGDGGARVDGFD